MSVQIAERDYRRNPEPIPQITSDRIGRASFHIIMLDQQSEGDRVLSVETTEYAVNAALGYVTRFPDNITFIDDYRKEVVPSIQAITSIVGDENKVTEIASNMVGAPADFLIAVQLFDDTPKIKETIASTDPSDVTDGQITSLRERLLEGNVTTEPQTVTLLTEQDGVIFQESVDLAKEQQPTPEQIATRIINKLDRAGVGEEITLARLISSLPSIKADLIRVHTSHSGKGGKTSFTLTEIEDAFIRKCSKGINPKIIRDLIDKQRKGGE